MNLSKEQEAELIAEARAAGEKAYAPYSDYQVGSALLFDDGAIITGTNVENASYGLALCAATVAVRSRSLAEQIPSCCVSARMKCAGFCYRSFCRTPSVQRI